MRSFVRDEQSAGHLRLPQERLVEMVNVLGAIRTLTEGITQRSGGVNADFYSEVVGLYSLLVECIPSSRTDCQVRFLRLVFLLYVSNALCIVNVTLGESLVSPVVCRCSLAK